MRLQIGLLAGALLALSACDVVRIPGDGRAAPPDIPEGAPGPLPPTTPIEDPYGDGDPIADPETPDTVTDTDTPTPADVDGTDTNTTNDDPADTDPLDTDTDTDPDTTPVTDDTPTEPNTDPEPPISEPEPLPIKFQYYAPGNLTPGSGVGTPDETVYAPNMVFPIKAAAAFPQSQVWRFGGGIGGGDQCDPRNFSTPWQDNFCEQRSKNRNTPMCPTNKVHQGQDVRVGTAEGCNQMRRASAADRTLYELVAVEDGIVQYIGGYYIQLRGTDSGNVYNYIHINMAALKVELGDTVTAGQALGYVSNDFGGTPTTFHLHFEIKSPLEGEGITHVPPYMSLVEAYERREGGRGEMIQDEMIAVASIPIIPEGFEIIE